MSAAVAPTGRVGIAVSHASLAPVTVERKRYFWTTREIALLKEHYPSVGVSGCLPILPGREVGAIYQKAAGLGIPAPRTPDRPRHRWTTTDHIDAAIQRVYETKPDKNAVNQLARAVMRPRWWVSKRASTLGFVAPRFKEPPWSEAEKEILHANAYKGPSAIRRALARRGFKRSETAIIVQRKRLGCFTEDPNHYTATGLAGLFGVDAKTVTRWIEKGWLSAGRRGTERTPLQGGDQWWIHRRDVRAFVIDSVAVIDIRKVDKYWLVDLLAAKFEAAP